MKSKEICHYLLKKNIIKKLKNKLLIKFALIFRLYFFGVGFGLLDMH